MFVPVVHTERGVAGFFFTRQNPRRGAKGPVDKVDQPIGVAGIAHSGGGKDVDVGVRCALGQGPAEIADGAEGVGEVRRFHLTGRRQPFAQAAGLAHVEDFAPVGPRGFEVGALFSEKDQADRVGADVQHTQGRDVMVFRCAHVLS